ncbi:MAG TPA: LacI family DNA-binding transcriptional regulator [Nitrolancea sp.]|nr:LacI family DNA-binding transcriptional regulator [Nitrolancea sp.]
MPRPNRGQAATLNDVARLANVSRQTVSRVINNKDTVRPETEQRVRAAIRELDYRPNSLARSLVTNRSNVIGLVVPNISQPYYPEIARGVEDGAYEADYSVFLSHTGGDAGRELRALERLRGHRVDGVIICNSRLDDETLSQVAALAPAVLVNRQLANVSGTVIWTGYDTGSELAIDHLHAVGRRRIAYVGLDYVNNVDAAKFLGYRTGLERNGIPFDSSIVVRGPNSFQGGYAAMEALYTAALEVDAIFASNDLLAIGAMRYALTHGVDVPGEMAFVGFGGSEVASMVTPDLTTISVPLYSIGVTAVQELLQLIACPGEQHRQLNIKPEILIRGSSVANQRAGVAQF